MRPVAFIEEEFDSGGPERCGSAGEVFFACSRFLSQHARASRLAFLNRRHAFHGNGRFEATSTKRYYSRVGLQARPG
jgi:hypothetical protein